MTGPATAVPRDFWKRLENSARAILLLDYDGTLAPFRDERHRAVPYPGVGRLLDAIRAETATRLVIVSGRSLDDLIPLLDLSPPPELWGCHGWEQWQPGRGRKTGGLAPPVRKALGEALRLAGTENLAGHCEVKPASVAFHWRGLAEDQRPAAEAAIAVAWTPLTRTGDLELHPFDGGLELRVAGFHKGRVVELLLAEEGQKPGTTPRDQLAIAFLGDDRTDEDAFKALKNRGLAVLVRAELRPTEAEVHLVPPAGLLDFLRNWLARAPREE